MDTTNYKNIAITIPQPIYHELHHLTGHHVETFQWILFCYGEELQLSHKVFIDTYIYIHIYPCVKQSPALFQRSRQYISRSILPALEKLARTLNEIHWDERLNPYNHTPHFPHYINSIVDMFPIYVSQPQMLTLPVCFTIKSMVAAYGRC